MIKKPNDIFLTFHPSADTQDIVFTDEELVSLDEDTPEELDAAQALKHHFLTMKASDIITEPEHEFFDSLVNSDVCFGDIFDQTRLEALIEDTSTADPFILQHALKAEGQAFYDTYSYSGGEILSQPNTLLANITDYRFTYEAHDNANEEIGVLLSRLDNVASQFETDDDDDFI